jgi:hypothetical protein
LEALNFICHSDAKFTNLSRSFCNWLKANKSLGFLRRNISKFPEEIKKRAYQAIVRPNVEYASSAWDPYQENQIKKIEMVQRRSARFIHHPNSTNLMVNYTSP